MKPDKEITNVVPYVTFLQNKGKPKLKKRKSSRQIKFEKWLKNF